MGTRHCGLGKETVYGTAVAPTRFFEAVSETIGLVKNTLPINTIRSRTTRAIALLNELVRGDIEAVFNYQEIGELLRAFYGAVTTTGAGPFTHTFPPSTGFADRESWTIELQRDSTALTWRYAGMLCTALGIDVGLDRAGQVTSSWLGKSEATGTAASPTFRTLDVAPPSQVAITFDGGAVTARSCTVDLARPADEPHALGSTTFAFTPQDSDVITARAELEIYFSDLTTYNKFVSQADVDLAIVMTGAAADTLTINMNKCKITGDPTPHLDGRNRLLHTVTLESYFDATATENVQAILVNDQTTVP